MKLLCLHFRYLLFIKLLIYNYSLLINYDDLLFYTRRMTASLVSSGDSKTAVNSNTLEWPMSSFWIMMIATYNKASKLRAAERRHYRPSKHKSLESTSDNAQWTTQQKQKILLKWLNRHRKNQYLKINIFERRFFYLHPIMYMRGVTLRFLAFSHVFFSYRPKNWNFVL